MLCRIRAVAICGSDPEIIRGGLAGYWPPAYPFVAVGNDVRHHSIGDHVAGEAHKEDVTTCAKTMEDQKPGIATMGSQTTVPMRNTTAIHKKG